KVSNCFFCFRSGHLIANCEAYKQKQLVSRARSVPASKADTGVVSRAKTKLCFFCHKPGHLVANCLKAHSKQKGN
uniref:CCHC-type domain-containing protein n=1 Tax=Neolamprologus brichardi TaxID=32507 RepID=A0A3Q4G3Z3_NEOBR